ncbi:EamA/RhaT family transporter [Aurantibacter sp.]|uniref:EamA family transporter n=1 Tax=Aurantibacter sp. TaxID=2807103 RepID=UPI0035C8373C
MYLLLSILCSTLIFIIFKCFEKFKVNTLQAIVVNYYAAAIFGFLNYDAPIIVSKITSSNWFIGALCLAVLFIVVFNFMALTAQKNGLSVASVASKMSVVIPIIFGLYAYNESLNLQKTIGIILALVAVYLASIKATNSGSFQIKSLILPIILFLGSGTIDTTIKYVETNYVAENGIPLFSATIFSVSGLIGITLLVIKTIKKPQKLSYKPLIGGAILGIVNYYSIVMLLKALQMNGFESSTIFTVNNVGVVMLSTLVGLLLFKETLIRKNWIGIALAIVSITLVTFA